MGDFTARSNFFLHEGDNFYILDSSGGRQRVDTYVRDGLDKNIRQTVFHDAWILKDYVIFFGNSHDQRAEDEYQSWLKDFREITGKEPDFDAKMNERERQGLNKLPGYSIHLYLEYVASNNSFQDKFHHYSLSELLNVPGDFRLQTVFPADSKNDMPFINEIVKIKESYEMGSSVAAAYIPNDIWVVGEQDSTQHFAAANLYRIAAFLVEPAQ